MKDATEYLPGNILWNQFMKPRGISAYRLAKDIGVPANRIYGIVNNVRGISKDTAVRLGKYFGNEPRFWFALQFEYFEKMVDMKDQPVKEVMEEFMYPKQKTKRSKTKVKRKA